MDLRSFANTSSVSDHVISVSDIYQEIIANLILKGVKPITLMPWINIQQSSNKIQRRILRICLYFINKT